jgi:hypothetical protein
MTIITAGALRTRKFLSSWRRVESFFSITYAENSLTSIVEPGVLSDPVLPVGLAHCRHNSHEYIISRASIGDFVHDEGLIERNRIWIPTGRADPMSVTFRSLQRKRMPAMSLWFRIEDVVLLLTFFVVVSAIAFVIGRAAWAGKRANLARGDTRARNREAETRTPRVTRPVTFLLGRRIYEVRGFDV